jgi:dienelactone hydrolase
MGNLSFIQEVIMTFPDFSQTTFTYNNKTKNVYQKGNGPAVIIIHEIPGITPRVADFGRRVANEGFTAVLPDLFGTVGKPETGSYILKSLVGACISREFVCFARGQSSPIVDWLKGLCRHSHAQHGGKGVGALGMCLTGGFALALMVDPSVMAPVLSQPSLPFPITAKHRADLGISPTELAQVKARVQDGCSVLGLRFTNDATSPADRFATLRQELGDGFVGIEIDSSPNNPHNLPQTAHSVLTREFVDEPNHPTRQAFDRVITMFRERL